MGPNHGGDTLRTSLTIYESTEQHYQNQRRAQLPRLWRHAEILGELDDEYGLSVEYQTPMPRLEMAGGSRTVRVTVFSPVVAKPATKAARERLYSAEKRLQGSSGTRLENAVVVTIGDDQAPTAFSHHTNANKIRTPARSSPSTRAFHLDTAIRYALVYARSRTNSAVLQFVLKDLAGCLEDLEVAQILDRIMERRASKEDRKVFGDLVSLAEETWYYDQGLGLGKA